MFVLGQVLPSDPGRSVLGPLAAPSAVHALDHQLGVDKPILTQYWHWLTNSPGTSYQYQAQAAASTDWYGIAPAPRQALDHPQSASINRLRSLGSLFPGNCYLDLPRLRPVV